MNDPKAYAERKIATFVKMDKDNPDLCHKSCTFFDKTNVNPHSTGYYCCCLLFSCTVYAEYVDGKNDKIHRCHSCIQSEIS